MDIPRQRPDQPSAGDIVIVEDTRTGRGYTLGTTPGPPQLWYAAYEAALEKATLWSFITGVGVWRSEDNKTFARVVIDAPNLDVAGARRAPADAQRGADENDH